MHRCLCLSAMVALVAFPACSRRGSAGWQGYLEGEHLRLAAPVSGRVERLHVERGATVEAGAPLFELEPEPEASAHAEQLRRLDQVRARLEDLRKGSRPAELAALEARLNAARSRSDLAETLWRRARDLQATRVVPQEDLDRAETEHRAAAETVAQLESELATARLGGREDALRAAEAEVAAAEARAAQLRWLLDEKGQRAPVAGLVTELFFRPGERAAAGSPVVELLPPDRIKVRFFVPPDALARLAIGQAVEVRVAGGRDPMAATVVHVRPEAEFTPPVIYSRETAHKLVHLVEARPDRPDPALLHPGLPVEVRP